MSEHRYADPAALRQAIADRLRQLVRDRPGAQLSDLGRQFAYDRLLARRVQRAVEIAYIKVDEGIPLRSVDREIDLLADARAEADLLGLDPVVVQALLEQILDYSRRCQAEAVERRE